MLHLEIQSIQWMKESIYMTVYKRGGVGWGKNIVALWILNVV